jgi:hypothetical protein
VLKRTWNVGVDATLGCCSSVSSAVGRGRGVCLCVCVGGGKAEEPEIGNRVGLQVRVCLTV